VFCGVTERKEKRKDEKGGKRLRNKVLLEDSSVKGNKGKVK
jgi:hypothetical protein